MGLCIYNCVGSVLYVSYKAVSCLLSRGATEDCGVSLLVLLGCDTWLCGSLDDASSPTLSMSGWVTRRLPAGNLWTLIWGTLGTEYLTPVGPAALEMLVSEVVECGSSDVVAERFGLLLSTLPFSPPSPDSRL